MYMGSENKMKVIAFNSYKGGEEVLFGVLAVILSAVVHI